MTEPDFATFFFKIAKINFPKMKSQKTLFKQKNDPGNYLEVIAQITDLFIQKQLLLTFIICCNHFKIDPVSFTTQPMIREWIDFRDKKQSTPLVPYFGRV